MKIASFLFGKVLWVEELIPYNMDCIVCEKHNGRSKDCGKPIGS
jgi:hypothetical protein